MSSPLWSAALDLRVPDQWRERVHRRPASAEGARWTPRPRSPALVLGALFLSLYLLTMGGHLDSPDEELMFQVTRSLAEHGSLSITAPQLAEQLAAIGVDGRVYVPYSPVASIMSVPFYAVGTGLGQLLPARYAEVAARFGVGLRDPFVSAAACMLVYALAVQLGYGVRVSMLVTLAFGLATLVWPFARHSFSEPVTGFWLLVSVLAAVRAVRGSRPIGWSSLCALALGLAIASKATAGLALPALLVYLVAAGAGARGCRLRRVLPFLLVLGLPALAMALLNVARFGSPIATGYNLQGLIEWSHPIGIAGLLVSPSKSVFLYAPVALLGTVGLAALWKRLPWEAAVFSWLVVSHVVFHGLLVIWSGDAAWGPRYLVPIIPFLVLPAGALLSWTRGGRRRACWAAFAALAGVGVVVNLGGVLVDQRVAFDILMARADGNLQRLDELRWDPSLSPVLIQWQEFARRFSRVAASWSQPVSLLSGTYGVESVEPADVGAVPQPNLFPRWTTGAAAFEVRTNHQPLELLVEYFDNRPASLGPATVDIRVDGTPLPPADVVRSRSLVPVPDKRLPWFIHARLDQASTAHDPITVEVDSSTWQPARDAGPSSDVRVLGIQLWDVRFWSNARELPVNEALFSPMPVSDAKPWSYELMTWFYTQPWQLVDNWLWYLSLSGLPRWLLLLGLLPAGGVVWSALRNWAVLRSAR